MLHWAHDPPACWKGIDAQLLFAVEANAGVSKLVSAGTAQATAPTTPALFSSFRREIPLS
ncbi:MAG TPA: hypothetical protein VEM41_10065 [Actinomycetota bacterium]|nr:hypothetical protein [Actinomycetota bacterium]